MGAIRKTGSMKDINIGIKDVLGIIVLVVGITGSYFVNEAQMKVNASDILEMKLQIQEIQKSDTRQDLAQNTLINDVAHIREQTNQIYQIVVLNSIGGGGN